jgi:transposase
MSGKCRKHSPEFKLEAVRLAQESGKSVADIAQDLGIRAHQIYTWQRDLARKQAGLESENGRGKLTSQDEEIRRLRRDLKIACEERDILKKATAFFAKTSH